MARDTTKSNRRNTAPATLEADPVCRYCGVPSTVVFCSDECEQLSDWERPDSTDVGPGRFNLLHTIVDTCVMAVLIPAALSLLAL
jgi:hypothetical protein